MRTDADHPARPPGTGQPAPRLYWWKEVIYCAVFYTLYSRSRNTQGSASISVTHGYRHARGVMRAERWLGIFYEEPIQKLFLGHKTFLQFWNVYYGTAHFIVTFVAIIWCYRKLPRRYQRMRNTLACMTGLALIGFVSYPLMPPRLLPGYYGFVDTLKVYGGIWNFDSGAIAKASNQYAAMPSLHFGWATWCSTTLWPGAYQWWKKAGLVLYPCATLFGIIVTGNHFFLDAVGGFVVFAIGLLLGTLTATWWDRRGHTARKLASRAPGEH